MRSIELFAGAGGLALGLGMAGFRHELVVEWDEDSCQTLLSNQERGLACMDDWNILKADVSSIDYSNVDGEIELVGGGPPCQPFSIGGKHKGHSDQRNMWPETIRAVRELLPRAFLFENVRGLLRPAFGPYLRYIALQLEMPMHVRKNSMKWQEHLERLERIRAGAKVNKDLLYRVQIHAVDAADYGAAQRRRRVIIAGIRCDQSGEWKAPIPTHSRKALLWEQWVTEEYWNRHGISPRWRPRLPMEDQEIVNSLRKSSRRPKEQAWRTVRDAIGDLGEPLRSRETFPNHRLWPGAKAYPGHTGSYIDLPAKALKAGVHGVPGGENMLALQNGDVRYFTVREAARLQGFPDKFLFPSHVSWTECMRQLGNAVPVPLARYFGRQLSKLLSSRSLTKKPQRAA